MGTQVTIDPLLILITAWLTFYNWKKRGYGCGLASLVTYPALWYSCKFLPFFVALIMSLWLGFILSMWQVPTKEETK